ncbi:hypothetical protein [Streptomyces sp. NBC_00996]|uniref:hypothetical protein n=1 Tax=Streptomyces sp. NBC_00996 TaxID=2903710 RepID=UPI0038669DD6|nr:hypothetical protein OG390_22815 [Streptomyces sp. NBC_00996]
MSSMAGEWWENVNVWAIVVSAVVALLVGSLGTWATFRSANPKRKLNWWVQSNTPLMSVPQHSADGALAVTFHGVSIDNPRIVELVIANQGRRDLTSAMFHNSESIRFDFGAVLCTILDVTTAPAGSMPPSLEHFPWRLHVAPPSAGSAQLQTVVGETWLDLKPSLLSKGQVVTVAVLLDGEEKPVRLTRFPLVDVAPASEPPGARSRVLAEAITQASISVGPFRIR